MISKKARQAMILEIINERRVESQESLSALLRDKGRDKGCDKGMDVAQTTISRDIRELGLVKIRGRYQADAAPATASYSIELRSAFEHFVIRTDVAGNIVVVRTSSGNAHSVCVALDAAGWPEIVGTIAGDDTIFVLTRSSDECGELLKRIRELAI